MFELVAAASGLMAAGRMREASAQGSTRIERLAPELDAIIDTSQPVRELATGFGGTIGPAEGPVWIAEGRYLLLNDIQTSRRMKYTPGQGAVVAKTPTNEANGFTRDLQGRLIAAEHATRRVTREDPVPRLAGPRIHLAHRGRSDGAERACVFARRTRDLCQRHTAPHCPSVRSPVRRHGCQAVGASVADMNGPEPGVPDGMKVDTAGNVYTGGAGGLYIMDKTGKKLGRIVHGVRSTSNIAFGGDDWKSLYFTTASSLNMVTLKIAGVPVPPRKKT
jgi:gluconolactonase